MVTAATFLGMGARHQWTSFSFVSYFSYEFVSSNVLSHCMVSPFFYQKTLEIYCHIGTTQLFINGRLDKFSRCKFNSTILLYNRISITAPTFFT